MFAVRLRTIVLALLCCLLVGGRAGSPGSTAPGVHVEPLRAFERAPLRFEPTADGFVADARHTRLVLDPHGARFLSSGAEPVSMRVAGGRVVAPVAGDLLPTRVNRLRGRDRSQWRQNIPTYGRVTYPSVRDGVDLVFHGEHGQLEYDFVVAPGVDPSEVALEIDGGDVRLDVNGALAIGATIHERPRVYQRDDLGRERDVAAHYRVLDSKRVGFEVAAYDHTRPLVIDPVAGYTSFFGGAGSELALALGADDLGNVYVAGATTDFTGFVVAPGKVLGGPPPPGAGSDAFVAKVDPSGTLVYVTVLGGANDDSPVAIVPDAQRQAIVAMVTSSPDLPTTSDAPQKKLATAGGPFNQDAFLATLTPDGSDLAFATYLDLGTNDHLIACLDVADPTQQCFERFLYNDKPSEMVFDGETLYLGGTVALSSISNVFQASGSAPVFLAPGTTNTSEDGGFVAAVSTKGVVLAKRFFGRAEGKVRLGLAGSDLFVASDACSGWGTVKLVKPGSFQDAPAGACEAYFAVLDRGLVGPKYGTWLGGSGLDHVEHVLAVSPSEVYVTGSTESPGFPTPSGPGATGEDGFIVRFDPTKTGPASVVWSRLYGGNGSDGVMRIARSPAGQLYVVGLSASTDFPVARATSDLASYYSEVSSTDGAPSSTLLYDSASSQDAALSLVYAAGGPVILGFSFESLGGPDTFPNTKNLQPGRGGAVDVFLARVPDGTDLPVDPGKPDAGPEAGPDPGPSPELVVTPLDAKVPPRGHVAIKAVGTPPYVFTFASNASGATVDASGSYVAGRRGSVIDQVRVTDALGHTKTVTVTVGPAITLTPDGAAVAQNETKVFAAAGGAGAPYTWSASAGAIDANGTFHAPASNVTVVVTATDALGNIGSANVAIGTAVAIAPASPIVGVGERVQFSAFGGTGAYTYAVTTALGGAIDASTGLFTAGPNAGLETVEVADSAGNRSAAVVTVLPPSVATPLPAPSGSSGSASSSASSSSSSSGSALLATPVGGTENGGCDCRTGRSSSPAGAVLGVIVGLLMLRRRRK